MLNSRILTPKQFQQMFPAVHQQVCDELGMGFVPVIFRTVAALNPEIALSSWNMVRQNLCRGVIARATKELMFAYSSNKRDCEYCLVAHHAMALKYGFNEQSVSEIFNAPHKIRNPLLRAAIEFTDACTVKDVDKIQQTTERLYEVGLDESEVTELIGMVSCALYMINIADATAVIPEQAFHDVIENRA